MADKLDRAGESPQDVERASACEGGANRDGVEMRRRYKAFGIDPRRLSSVKAMYYKGIPLSPERSEK